jgi:hypothetical protein
VTDSLAVRVEHEQVCSIEPSNELISRFDIAERRRDSVNWGHVATISVDDELCAELFDYLCFNFKLVIAVVSRQILRANAYGNRRFGVICEISRRNRDAKRLPFKRVPVSSPRYGSREEMSYQAYRRRFKSACESAGIPENKRRPYNLRHTRLTEVATFMGYEQLNKFACLVDRKIAAE